MVPVSNCVIDCVVQCLVSLILWCVLEGGVVSRDGCRVGVVSERVGKDCVCTCSAIYEMLFFLNAFSLLLTMC